MCAICTDLTFWRRMSQTDVPETDDRDGGPRRMPQTDVPKSKSKTEVRCVRVCVSVCLCVCVSRSVYLSICLPACLPACHPACLHACLPACLPVCLSVCFLLLCSVYYVFPFDSVYQLPKLLSIYILLILLSFDWYMFC